MRMSLPTCGRVDVLVEHGVDPDRRGVQPGLVREGGQADVRLVGVRRDVRDLADRVRDPRHLPDALAVEYPLALLELQSRDDAEQVRVAGPLAVAVRGALHVGDARLDGDQGVRDAAAGVVVAVDAQARLRCLRDAMDDVGELGGHHAAVGVAQRDHVRARLRRRADALERVPGVGPVAVEEVLGVEEDPLAFRPQVPHRVGDHLEVLVERGPQRELHVPVVALGDQGDHRGARLAERGDLRVVRGDGARLARRAERRERGVLEAELGLGAAEELGVLGDGARPAALDEPDAEPVQVPRDHQLVGNREVQALLLCPVAQGGVVDVELVVEHCRFPFLPCRGGGGRRVSRKQKDPSRDARGLRVGIVAQVRWPRLGLPP